MEDGFGIGSMTLQERAINKIDKDGNQAEDENLGAFLPGYYDADSPLLGMTQSLALRRAMQEAHRNSQSVAGEKSFQKEMSKINRKLHAEATRQMNVTNKDKGIEVSYSVLRPRVYEPPNLQQDESQTAVNKNVASQMLFIGNADEAAHQANLKKSPQNLTVATPGWKAGRSVSRKLIA